ncbi:MAG: tRNA (adenosine(37)-N6)-dimethylallyltransferase MiaA [Nannocystaceae bacterium]
MSVGCSEVTHAGPTALALVGPTAAGKTDLGVAVAQQFGLPILCCDSVQVYRGLNIGSAKPSAAQRGLVSHALLDLVEPSACFSAGEYGRRACARIDRTPGLFVGGTGFYLRSAAWSQSGDLAALDLPRADPRRMSFERQWLVREGQTAGAVHAELARRDVATAEHIHPRNVVRALRSLWLCERHGEPVSAVRGRDPPRRRMRLFAVVLDPGRETVDRAIARRTEQMIAAGWVAEVEGLREAGYDGRCEAMRSLGYRQLLEHLEVHTPLAYAVEAIKRATQRYSRKQRTFFRNQFLTDQIVYISRPEEFPYARAEAFLRGRPS